MTTIDTRPADPAADAPSAELIPVDVVGDYPTLPHHDLDDDRRFAGELDEADIPDFDPGYELD